MNPFEVSDERLKMIDMVNVSKFPMPAFGAHFLEGLGKSWKGRVEAGSSKVKPLQT